MDFIELMNTRYTTKKYDSKRKVEGHKIEELKKVLQLSASSINSQPWKFTFVKNPEIKAQLAEASFFNKPKVLDCDTVVVFSVLDSAEDFENQITEFLPQGAIDYYNSMLKPQGEATVKSWMSHQVYLALGFFLSACISMGIDSTPMEGIEADKYKEIIGNKKHDPLFAVAIGYRAEDDKNQPSIHAKSRLDENLVINEI